MGAQSVTIYKGDTSFAITVPAALLGVTNLSGYSSIWVTAKHSRNDPDTAGAGFPQAVFQKTLGAGVTVTTAGSGTVNGMLTVTLADADTSGLYDLENGLPLHFDAKGKTAGGVEKTLVSDILIVLPHSTKAT